MTNSNKTTSSKDYNSRDTDNKSKSQKKSIIRLFGYEISAPTGMKNPLLILMSLIGANLLLLLILKRALSI